MSDDEELVFHDEIELEDFEFDEELGAYTYPCPCGDRFVITEDELEVRLAQILAKFLSFSNQS